MPTPAEVEQANPYTLVVYRGRLNEWSMQYLDTDGVAVDLTGRTITAHVKKYAGGPLMSPLTIVVTDAATGKFDVSLTVAASRKLTQACRWDMKVAIADEEPVALVSDSHVVVIPEVTS